MNFNNLKGVTLIELVIAIVVISIGLSALLITITNMTSRSADPAVQQQGMAIAQSYMEEILSQAFCDPNDFSTDCFADCTANACGSCSGATALGGGGESRSTYDDVCDYAAISDEATADINGPISELADYSVTVTVDDSGESLGSLDSDLGEVVRIDVVVTHTNGFSTTLTAYKVNF